jgi:hypothetical protein
MCRAPDLGRGVHPPTNEVQLRKLIALLALVATAACSSDSPTNPASASIAGTYTMTAIDGSPLPFTFQSGTSTVVLLSDVMTVADGGTWSETGTFRVTQNGSTSTQTFVDGGTWSRAGTGVSFYSDALAADSYIGTFTGTSFNLADDTFTYVFVR